MIGAIFGGSEAGANITETRTSNDTARARGMNALASLHPGEMVKPTTRPPPPPMPGPKQDYKEWWENWKRERGLYVQPT